MVAPKTFAWSFRNVAVNSKGVAYFAASHDASMERNIPVTFYMRWADQWGSKPFNINGTAICFVEGADPCLILGGVEWSMLVISSREPVTETVAPTAANPAKVGNLRELRAIGGEAYAVGMGRTAYRRKAARRWERIDQGLRMSGAPGESGGLNSIDGTSKDELVAVGWGGEIWQRNSSGWKILPSPTNLALFRVVRSPGGSYFVVGQRGTILRVDEGQVLAVDQELTREDFSGAVFFNGSLYLSASNGIFRLIDGVLEEVPIVGPRRIELAMNDCFYRLATNGRVLYSAGPKMVVWSEDGVVWNELPYQ